MSALPRDEENSRKRRDFWSLWPDLLRPLRDRCPARQDEACLNAERKNRRNIADVEARRASRAREILAGWIRIGSDRSYRNPARASSPALDASQMVDWRSLATSLAASAAASLAILRVLRRSPPKVAPPLVSVIVPAYNALPWLHEALRSVLAQSGVPLREIEVSICDDHSTDGTRAALRSWSRVLQQSGVRVVIGETTGDSPRGDGAARNVAVRQSTGQYLCFLDADDVMFDDRICAQLRVARTNHNAIVGSGFVRRPAGSTRHYTDWANSLTREQLYLQQYREITIIQPTWFCHRSVFVRAGGYPEFKGLNDLEFFHRHLDRGGALLRVPRPLLMYRYSSGSLSWKSSRRELLRARMRPLERRVLDQWDSFSIWGAGRDGLNFFNDLSERNRAKVAAFCDISPKKINKKVVVTRKGTVPIVHWSQVTPPVVICVSMGRTGGALEANIASLRMREGIDYWHFS